jgi:hypothetical protein
MQMRRSSYNMVTIVSLDERQPAVYYTIGLRVKVVFAIGSN